MRNSKQPQQQRSPDHYRFVREYFDYHNHQEFISFSEFLETVVSSIAHFHTTDLPQNFEEQLRYDIKQYGGHNFIQIAQLLKTGGWSKNSIARLTPDPRADELFGSWFEYWLVHDLKKLEKAYRNLCFNVLDSQFMSVRSLNSTLKDIAAINKKLITNGIDVGAWHQRIESDHQSYSARLIPDVLTYIFENTSSANSKMFSGLNNHNTMTKTVAILPPVLAGTLEALNDILGWGAASSQLPVCQVSSAQIKIFCKRFTEINYNDFNAIVGTHYQNLQQRAQLLNAAKPSSSAHKLKRKI